MKCPIKYFIDIFFDDLTAREIAVVDRQKKIEIELVNLDADMFMEAMCNASSQEYRAMFSAFKNGDFTELNEAVEDLLRSHVVFLNPEN